MSAIRLGNQHLFRQAIVLLLCGFFLQCAQAGFKVVQPEDDRWPIRQFLAPPPTIYVLSIGINHISEDLHKIGIYDLRGTAQDANLVLQAFQGNLTSPQTLHVEKAVLLDSMATKVNIRAAIQKFALESKGSDLFVLSFSGHAFTETKNGLPESYLVPADVRASGGCASLDCIDESSLISGSLLNSWMSQLHAQRQILLLDSSHTDLLIPSFEQHWRKESCSVGPLASKRLLLVTNHGSGFESPTIGAGVLSYEFVQEIDRLRKAGLLSAFRLQQALYRAGDPEELAATTKREDTQEMYDFRVDMLGGDFVIDAPKGGVKRTDLLLDSDRGPLCGPDSIVASRGQRADDSPAPPAPPAPPTNYALIIATDNYKNWPHLDNPVFDATAIEHDLGSIYGFKTEHLWSPSRTQLRQKLNDWHARTFNPDDQLFIFIAGHGDYDEASDIGYLVFPETSSGHDYDSELSLLDLRKMVDKIPARHVFLVMDSCFAGSLDPSLGGGKRGAYDPIPLAKLRERTADKTTKYFLTSGGKEYVPDGIPGHHSPFAALFITALERRGQPDGYLNLSQFPHYFERMETTPRAGNLGDNEDGADFFFIPVSVPEAAN